jgi:hypothetical protein
MSAFAIFCPPHFVACEAFHVHFHTCHVAIMWPSLPLLQIKMTLTTADGTVCSEGEALHIGARPKEGSPVLGDVFQAQTTAKL